MSGGPGGGSKNLQSVPATGLGGAGHAVIFAILSMMMQKKRVAPLFWMTQRTSPTIVIYERTPKGERPFPKPIQRFRRGPLHMSQRPTIIARSS